MNKKLRERDIVKVVTKAKTWASGKIGEIFSFCSNKRCTARVQLEDERFMTKHRISCLELIKRPKRHYHPSLKRLENKINKMLKERS